MFLRQRNEILTYFALSLFLMLSVSSLEKGDICNLTQDGETGFCTLLSACSSAVTNLKAHRKRPIHCGGFEHLMPIVCCKEDDSVLLDNETTVVKVPTVEGTSVNKCRFYANLVFRNETIPHLLAGLQNKRFEIVNTCEINDTSTSIVTAKEFPHLVSLGYVSTSEPIYKCTGALIDENYVVVTASCTDVPYYGVPVVVRVGRTVYEEFTHEFPPTQYLKVQEFIRHPKYNSTTKANNIALIKFTSPAILNRYARPACLGQRAMDLDMATVAGYGSFGNNHLFKSELRKNILRFGNDCKCSQLRRNCTPGSNNQFCIQMDTQNNCVIDNGAPVQIQNRNPYCTYSITGLVSSWDECSDKKPASITDVSKYVKWIENTVWD